MKTITTEEQNTPAATAPAQEPKANTKANVAPRKPPVARSKATSRKKSSPPKKAARAAKPAKKPNSARQGTKTAKVLDLLKRAGGVSLKDIMKATDWQAHSVRGFISGTLGKKMALKIESTKREDGERVYRLAR